MIPGGGQPNMQQLLQQAQMMQEAAGPMAGMMGGLPGMKF